jgi:hypothetical protein
VFGTATGGVCGARRRRGHVGVGHALLCRIEFRRPGVSPGAGSTGLATASSRMRRRNTGSSRLTLSYR